MKKLLLSILTIAACADTDAAAPIDRDTACHEQADAWCQAVGYPTPGCEMFYTHECEPGDLTPIPVEAQNACLDAIAQNSTQVTAEPAACQATWSDR